MEDIKRLVKEIVDYSKEAAAAGTKVADLLLAWQQTLEYREKQADERDTAQDKTAADQEKNRLEIADSFKSINAENAAGQTKKQAQDDRDKAADQRAKELDERTAQQDGRAKDLDALAQKNLSDRYANVKRSQELDVQNNELENLRKSLEIKAADLANK